jgi:hypothetical protein
MFSCSLTAFTVAPVGFKEESLKVIVCAAILSLSPSYIWMGAGCTPSCAAALFLTFPQAM